jgi:low affinity Fe/Cu permease
LQADLPEPPSQSRGGGSISLSPSRPEVGLRGLLPTPWRNNPDPSAVSAAPGRDRSRRMSCRREIQAMSFNRMFTSTANRVAYAAGKPATFIGCCAVIVLWAATGPFLGFSDTWQLVINTGTTIVTFLMVFLIQNTQNRDGAAIQAKLDELIRVGEAENKFIGIEHLTEEEVEDFRLKCEKAAKRADRAAARANRAAVKEAAK